VKSWRHACEATIFSSVRDQLVVVLPSYLTERHRTSQSFSRFLAQGMTSQPLLSSGYSKSDLLTDPFAMCA